MPRSFSNSTFLALIQLDSFLLEVKGLSTPLPNFLFVKRNLLVI